MARRKSLEYVIPSDNISVNRIKVIDAVPNLNIDPLTNPNFGLNSTGVGYNMYGQLIDYNTGNVISENKAKSRAKKYANNLLINRIIKGK